jgi:hypothetical protein
MAFKRKKEQKELNLPSLIDVVFLLLIYSLVTIPIERSESTSEQKTSASAQNALNLPFVPSRKAVDIGPVFRSFLIQIENTAPDDPKSDKTVYVLNPSVRDSTIGQARETALRDSTFARFPENFLQMSDAEFSRTKACMLIREQIRRLAKRLSRTAEASNRIEIRAVRNTEFRIVNFIMKECSAYGDSIPAIAVRTLVNAQ